MLIEWDSRGVPSTSVKNLLLARSDNKDIVGVDLREKGEVQGWIAFWKSFDINEAQIYSII